MLLALFIERISYTSLCLVWNPEKDWDMTKTLDETTEITKIGCQ